MPLSAGDPFSRRTNITAALCGVVRWSGGLGVRLRVYHTFDPRSSDTRVAQATRQWAIIGLSGVIPAELDSNASPGN
ncbi:MAG: hypothetical protein ACYTDW_03135 [Planctomycetota bacterium]